MLKLHPEILNEAQKELLPFIKSFAREYYLVGGTAVSLQIGHRQSIDFDLFKKSPISKTKIVKRLAEFGLSYQLLYTNSESFHIVVNDVKVTFFEYPYLINLQLVMFKKSLSNIPSFIAGDKTIIKEFVHPKNDVVDLNYSLAHAIVEVGEASEPHILTKSSELYVILSGEGELFIEKEVEILRGGDAALVPAGATQWIRNVGVVPLVFYVVVSPPWNEEQEIVFE